MKTVQYIQRSRKPGAKLPPNTICCTRGTKYGNRHRVERIGDFWYVFYGGKFTEKDNALREAVRLFENEFPYRFVRELSAADYLSCWCKPGAPCHVQDVLLPAVNAWIAERETK